MNKQEKAILGLGVYTALADGELEQAELYFIAGVARDVLGYEDGEEFAGTVNGLIKIHGTVAEAGGLDDLAGLIMEEAEKLTDESWRLLALKFCMLIAEQDGEFDGIEGHTIGTVMGTWASMDDGWDYSVDEAIDLAMAEDETDDEQTAEIKNGLYESFHENGQLHLRENYKDGELDGLVEEFYENGQLLKRENYKDGELDGPWEWFYENGELMTRATFINGKKEGLLESFHSNGQLQMTENYKDNELDGLVEEFDENGELSIREDYKDGEQTAIYKANGKFVNCDYSEMFWENLGDDFQRDDSIVIVEVIGDNFKNFIHPETETEAYKIFKNFSLKEIGYAHYGDWDELSSIIGKEEVEQLRKIYFDCDDYAETKWAVLLYHNFTYVTLVRGDESYKDGVLQDDDYAQTDDTITEPTETAPKDENTPVTAEPAEEVTVTLSKNHKTFKMESGDYRLERYKDGKIKAFKDDELCSNTKNVLRAINKEYKLGFTSGDFKKLHTRKLGKEIIEKMKVVQEKDRIIINIGEIKMDKETKAMIGLATYTACADADLEQEELAAIAGIGLALLEVEDEKTDSGNLLEEILQTMAEFVEAFDKAADDRAAYVTNLLKTEAGKITSTDGRMLATVFCMNVAEADMEVEDQEVVYMRIAHETWVGMNDGWELSWKELLERAVTLRQG